MSKGIYQEAADIIRERGWCRSEPIDKDGCVCLVGALWLVCGGEVETRQGGHPYINRRWLNHSTYHPARQRLTEKTVVDPSLWNDQSGRTVDEVLKLLEGMET